MATWQESDATWNADATWAPAPNDATWAPNSWDENGNNGGTNGSAAPPAEDAWAKSDWGQSEQHPPATEFWSTQKWNKESNVCPRKEEWELERDGEALFNQAGRAQASVDLSKYDAVPVDVSGAKADLIPVCKTFEEIYQKFNDLIPTGLQDNLKKVGYKEPTPVQKFAVPCGLVGRDIMCCAQTGSGKTVAFLIPVIGRMMKQHLNPVGAMTVPYEGPCKPEALVVTPTRELCIQIYEEAQKFCHRTNYRVTRVYGGEKPNLQMVELAKGTDLMIATPGRLQDFINREIIKVSEVHVFVLDEADRMLDMGFEPSIREIVEKHEMPGKENRQTMMFSATFPETCQKMAMEYLYEYIWIAVGVIGSAVETVQQILKKVDPKKKFEELIAILDEFYASRPGRERMLVFVNAKDTAKWLDEQLYDKKFDTGALHGNLTQEERERNLSRFRQGEIDVMVATDVAARGLDIENVAMVLNYDMPTEIDTYIHRIGRTGRIGNEGKAITFLSCEDGEGNCLEAVDKLKQLQDVMQNSNASRPDWLAGLIESAEASSGGWSWGGRDMRSDQESANWTGSGEAWETKGEDAQGAASWDKQEDTAWKEEKW